MLFSKKRAQRARGFTLIELLVVISIIGLLSSIVLAALNSAHSKARDIERIESLKEMVTALNLYYTTVGHYPNTQPFAGYNCWGTSALGGGNPCYFADSWQTGNWIPDGGNYNWSANYIPVQPHDPIDGPNWPYAPSGIKNTYAYASDGQKYVLAAYLENPSAYDIQNANTLDPSGQTFYTADGWPAQAYVIVTQ